MNACSVDGCGRDTRANGMCDTHDRQLKRTGRTGAIRPRRPNRQPEPKPDPAPAFACGDCGQAVGSWAGLKTHTCKPRERTPVMPLPLKAVPDQKKRPHPRELVDHPSGQIARAAKRVMDAVAALDKAWAADAEKAELRAERDRLKAQLAEVDARLRRALEGDGDD